MDDAAKFKRILERPEITPGTYFDNFDSLREHLLIWAAVGNKPFHLKTLRADKTQRQFACGDSNCSWVLTATKAPVGAVTVRKVGEHTCLPSPNQPRQPGSYLKFLEKAAKSLSPKGQLLNAKQLSELLRTEHKVNVSENQCWRALQAIKKDQIGDYQESICLLPSYLETLQAADSNVYTHIAHNPVANPSDYLPTLEDPGEATPEATTPEFRRVFVCPGASRTIHPYCLPIIALDGAHLSRPYKWVSSPTILRI